MAIATDLRLARIEPEKTTQLDRYQIENGMNSGSG